MAVEDIYVEFQVQPTGCCDLAVHLPNCRLRERANGREFWLADREFRPRVAMDVGGIQLRPLVRVQCYAKVPANVADAFLNWRNVLRARNRSPEAAPPRFLLG